MNKSLRVEFSVCIPSYERREWKVGDEMPSPPPDAPGVYVFEAWEQRDEHARKEFAAQFREDDTDDALVDPLEAFLDPADQAERCEFGVLAYRYVGQGKSLKKRLSEYVNAGKGPVVVESLTPDDLRGLSTEERVSRWLLHWVHFIDIEVALEEAAGPELSLPQHYQIESDVFTRSNDGPRTVTVGWVTEVGVYPNSIDPNQRSRVPLNNGHLRLAVESALVYAGGRSSWGDQQHQVINRAIDVPLPIDEDDDLPF